MFSTVSVGRIDPSAVPHVARLFTEYDSIAGGVVGLKRRQIYIYYDIFVQIQDFAGEEAVEVARRPAHDPQVGKLADDLAPYLAAYGPTIYDRLATCFYHWEGTPPIEKETGLHSTVIVNRVQDAVIPDVIRLFGELDETDFPARMGTRRRQLFSYHGVYFHIQDFEARDGNAVIDQAWKEADPRFVKICVELDPLVQKYAPEKWRSTDDQIAVRFYHWEAVA